MIRLLIKSFLFLVFIVLLAYWGVIGNNFLISSLSESRIFHDARTLPALRTGVLPGAGDSVKNLYFKGRVDAAALAIRHHKVRRLLLIGLEDGGLYHEPQNMAEALLIRGVSNSMLVQDTNGRRTFTTVLRARELSNGERVLFISQRPHLERILFIARWTGLEAIGLAADDQLPYQYPRYHRLREYFARLRCTWDCLVWIFSDG